jgi:hypothetical protein
MTQMGEVNHEYFEELCVLAALGQISREEYQQLQAHLQSCTECRNRQADFTEILHEHLPVVAPSDRLEVGAREFLHSAKIYKQHFIRRARSEGIDLSVAPVEPAGRFWHGMEAFWWSWRPRTVAFATLAVLFGLGMGVTGLQWHATHGREVQTAGKISSLSTEIARLKSENAQLLERAGTVATQAISNPSESVATEAERARFQAQLKKTLQEYEATAVRLKMYETQLAQANSELTSLRTEITTARTKAASAEKVHDLELALRQSGDELARLRQERLSEATLMASQEIRIKELQEELTSKGETLNQQQELVAATRDIRELWGARNMHIMDVIDEKNPDQRGNHLPLGRVIYTDKTLLVYAFDLDKNKKLREKFSFQVWGEKETKPGSPLNLGLLALDDPGQNRWVLRVDNPQALAQIDSVYITVGPKGGSAKPRSEKLGYAYLGAPSNYP